MASAEGQQNSLTKPSAVINVEKGSSVLDFFQRTLQNQDYLIEETQHFNKSEIKQLKQQFKRIANKHARLNLEGFRHSMGVLGMVQDSLLCQRLFSVFNKSKSGEITFAEFAEGLGVLMKGDIDEKLDFAFSMCDIDGSGEITYEELLLTVQSIMRIYSGIMGTANLAALDPVKVRKMFDKLDRNNDGKITVEEYKKGMRRHPELVESLRGTNLFQSGQYRVNELQKKRLRKYRKASESLMKSVGSAIKYLEGHEAEPERKVFARTPTIRSYETITDDEDDETTHSSEDNEETPEEKDFDLLGLLKEIETKLQDMSSDEYGSLEYERRKRNIQEIVVRDGAVATSEMQFPTSDAEQEENNAKTDSDTEALLKSYMTPSVKGSTVFFGHKNWDLVLNVMKGIQLAVSRCHAENREITSNDYGFKEKYTLVAETNHHSINSQFANDIDLDKSGRSCRFIDYAPFVFKNLRQHFGIRNEDYVHSIGPGNLLSNLMFGSLSSLSELGSEGKSGSIFYITSDNKYMVKRVSRDEHKLLRAILPAYHKHMVGDRNNRNEDNGLPDSLLNLYIGCHVVRLSKHSKIGKNKIYFIVMVNLLSSDLEIHRRFDLKGSWVGRSSSEAARKNPKKTLKDKDFTDLAQKIMLGPEKKKRLMKVLERDSEFLEEQGIIDYSLLLGVHVHSLQTKRKSTIKNTSTFSFTNGDNSQDDEDENIAFKTPWFREDDGGIRSIDGKETYIMGIIDCLITYNSRKKAERFGKTLLLMDREGISVMPPHRYRLRWLNFFEKQIE